MRLAKASALAALALVLGTSPPPATASPLTYTAAVAVTECSTADSLATAGNYAEAATAYVALIGSDPSLACALAGLTKVRSDEIAADCAAGDRLKSSGDLEEAKKQYEMAIETAAPLTIPGTPPKTQKVADDNCAVDGLKAISNRTSSLAPALWRNDSGAILRYAAGIALGAGLLILAAIVLMFLAGWMVRFGNRAWSYWNPDRVPRIRLVPRTKLTPLAGPSDGVTDGVTDALTPLLRGQMQAVQTTDDLHLDFVSSDSKVQGLVTAVKDLDARAGAWGEILLALNFMWPWPVLVIQGQVLPAGSKGEGLSVSIGVDARQPAAAEFWRYPDSKLPATEDGKLDDQRYYDLIPAVATWSVYEAARLGGTSNQGLSASGAVAHGYLAAGYALSASSAPDSGQDALRFYRAAEQADQKSISAQMSIVLNEASEKTYEKSADDINRLLFKGWLSKWDHDSKVWDV